MAAQERSVKNSVCLNHPDRPASTRCTVCFKPICAECAISSPDGTFCSVACQENIERTRGSVEAWRQQGARERARRLRRRLIKLIILVALGVAAYLYFTRNPGKFDELKEKTGRTVDEVRKGVTRTGR